MAEEKKTINAKTKGKYGELEVVNILKDRGISTARRSAQYHGNVEEGAPDVIGVDGLHIEVKRTEKLRLYHSMEQAIRDSELQQNGMPVVVHRRNREEWLCILRMDDFFDMWEALKEIGYWEGK